jgi:lysophospholipid acyltransferase (LPLAT)-like uncharacterized protein
MSWRASRAKRAQAALIPMLVWPVVEFLGASYSWRVDGREHLDRLDAAKQPYILAFWHSRILTGMLYFRDRGIKPLISENFDGEWIAGVCARFGFGAVRGSSSRGAARALVQSKRELAAGHSLLYTPDGPRGPARVVQPGVIWVAGASGCPILPARIEADRASYARSWDSHLFPSPNAEVHVTIGPLIHVPPDPDDETFEAKRLELERVLNAGRT